MHLSFREYLKRNIEDGERYGKLKMELAHRFPTDIKAYMAGKDACIQGMYRKIEMNHLFIAKYPIYS
jgi:GrpB-like predicted nucleotidyltransferase (UPF0157 family)